jgi:hypothetical protein
MKQVVVKQPLPPDLERTPTQSRSNVIMLHPCITRSLKKDHAFSALSLELGPSPPILVATALPLSYSYSLCVGQRKAQPMLAGGMNFVSVIRIECDQFRFRLRKISAQFQFRFQFRNRIQTIFSMVFQNFQILVFLMLEAVFPESWPIIFFQFYAFVFNFILDPDPIPDPVPVPKLEYIPVPFPVSLRQTVTALPVPQHCLKVTERKRKV